ncbi:hypothetical protein ABZ753_21630 [Streptomyces griseoincarnatus]
MTWTRRLFNHDDRITTRQKAAALYRAGHTIRCVAQAIGRPYTTTRDLLDEADVPFRPRGKASRCTANHEAA